MAQKRLAAIHDLSCFGKCSLTVALPVLSAAGVETAVIPTALLSTHTGGFSQPVIRDLTDSILPVAEHWNREGITVDAVYTGYLLSKEQIAPVLQAISRIGREDTLIVSDPVMADHGALYRGFSPDFPAAMLALCRAADVITPNVTEAALLTETPWKAEYSKGEIEEMLKRLYDLTGADIVMTGVSFEEQRLGAAVYEGQNAEFLFADRLQKNYHGTGDLFASALIAALLNEKSLRASAQVAINFVCGCIKATMDAGTEERCGVAFEGRLPDLIRMLS